MTKVEPKKFDISKSFPQVLLVGNGITRYGGCYKSWPEVIGQYAGDEYDERLKDSPYTIQATLYSAEQDGDQRERYLGTFSKGYTYREHPVIDKLIKLKTDAIITTNYTYEIENTLKKNYASLKDKNRYAFSFADDSRFLMTTFNRLSGPDGIARDIWHIHGEIRRPSSIVFTLDEYAREIGEIAAYNKKRGRDYQKYKDSVSFKSWFDYMILADVYIIGLGMDFSETDLWWLFNRRKRERAPKGKVFFFEPYESTKQDIYAALDKLGVKVEHLGFEKPFDPETKNEQFEAFYQSALDKTGELISTRGGVAK